MEQITQWWQDCLQSHELCNSPRIPEARSKLPARLLDIGEAPESQIRLLLKPEDVATQLGDQYITLSHCWGNAEYLKLTSATVDHLTNGIPVTELPQTFQDAIHIIRHLGLRLLWIDCLCIFQDSVSDRQQESGAMSSVYGGVICNIAASAAKDGRAGMFRERNPDLVRPCQISTLWDDHENIDLYLTETNWWEKCLDNDPLGQCSWVLQEVLLDRRVINFSTRQIFWECSQIHGNETYPKGIKTAKYKKKVSSLLACRSLESVCREAKLRSSEELLRWIWLDAVNSYSQRRLTKPSNKFVALSGVARILKCIFNESYLCGLWRRNLAQQTLLVYCQLQQYNFSTPI